MKSRFDPRNLTIGALLTLGIFIIIGLIISASFYSNYLTNSAQNIIEKSTSRIFDVLTIQRDTEELFSALGDLTVVQNKNELVKRIVYIDRLFTRADKTINNGREEQIFSEDDYKKASRVLNEVSVISSRIFSLKEESILKISERDENEPNMNSNQDGNLDMQFMNLRNIRFEMLGVFNEIVIRSDEEHRIAMNLVQRAQMITWIVIGISLGLALVLGFLLVRSVKKTFDLKNEFVNIIAHDLRNPVTALSGYLEILQSDKNKKVSDLNDIFQTLSVSTQTLKSQINNLLEVGRSEAGRIKLNIESVRPAEIIEESVARAKAFAEITDIKLIFKNEKASDVSIHADKGKLSEVLDNLISNAIKYNSKKGTVTITTENTNDYFKISVTDTGDGIPEDQQHKIFKKYSRLNTEKEKKVSGTGLGLYSVKLAMDKMKGKVDFQTKKGEGTTFNIHLHKSGEGSSTKST